jgi:hypothetical protein
MLQDSQQPGACRWEEGWRHGQGGASSTNGVVQQFDAIVIRNRADAANTSTPTQITDSGCRNASKRPRRPDGECGSRQGAARDPGYDLRVDHRRGGLELAGRFDRLPFADPRSHGAADECGLPSVGPADPVPVDEAMEGGRRGPGFGLPVRASVGPSLYRPAGLLRRGAINGSDGGHRPAHRHRAGP